MKKLIAAILSVLFVFALGGCTQYKDYPIEINGAYVSAGVYAYYLNEVLSNAKSYGVKANDKDAVKEAAMELCKKQTALLTFMKDEKIPLSVELKTLASENTEAKWDLFSEFYKSLGIQKSDLLKVMTYEASKKHLVGYYYVVGGKNEVSQDDLKQSFVELYVGFKAFEGDLTKVNTKGETVMLNKSEREEVINEFRKMRDRVNNGASIDKVYASYCEKQGLVATGLLPVSLMKDGDPMYDDTFFSDVSTITHGWAGVIISEKSVYLVERCTIATNDEDAFAEYRTEVLEYEKMPEIEKKIDKLAEKYELNVRKKLEQKISDYVFDTVTNL